MLPRSRTRPSLQHPTNRESTASIVAERLSIRAVGTSLAALLLCGACTGSGSTALPDYAAPARRDTSQDLPGPRDGVTYRQLERADFRAPGFPAELGAQARDLRAYSCVNIRVDYQANIDPTDPSDPAGTDFEARIDELRFESEFDRGCSWWNPEPTPAPERYVLEHEQIHFALFELEARRASRETPSLRIRARTEQAARRALGERVDRLLQQVLDEALELNREFDQETSLGYRPEAQQRWLERVRDQLRDSDS